MLVSLLKRIGLKFSLNDPGWGRGSQDNNKNNQDGKKPSNDGPPDLDQLWRDFNNRLGGLFNGRKNRNNGGDNRNNNNDGGGNGNGGGGMGGFRPDARGAGIGAGIIALIIGFLWLVSGFFIVQEGQTGVVMTFGKYSHSTPAGFNWRWPTPIQSHETVNVSQVRTVEIGYRGNLRNKQQQESLMLTEDENIIDIQFAVQYTLKNASDWVFNNRDQEELVKQIGETAIREVVGRSKMDFVLYEGREKTALDTSQLMQQIADRYRSGVQITNVTLQGVQPPEQVQAAFDDAVKAGQDRERQKNEGQAYANDVIPRARGTAARLMQESQAYRDSVVANAEGESSRFKQVYAEYQKAPAVTRDRMYIETMQKIFTSTTKVMVDTKSGNQLIYLPLDKLISQTGSPQQPAAAGTPGAQPQVPASSIIRDQHSMENQQQNSRVVDERSSRDREVR